MSNDGFHRNHLPPLDSDYFLAALEQMGLQEIFVDLLQAYERETRRNCVLDEEKQALKALVAAYKQRFNQLLARNNSVYHRGLGKPIREMTRRELIDFIRAHEI